MTEQERFELDLARHEIRKRQAPILWTLKETRKVSVVIVTYRRPDALTCILEQLIEQDYPNLEIIVIDSSPDAECYFSQLFRDRVGTLTYIISAVPYLGTVRNIGLLASRGDIVIFLDDDFFIDRDFVSRHVCLQSGNIYGQVELVVGNCVARPNEPVEWVKNANYHCPEGRYLSTIGAGGGHYSVKRDAALACGGFLPWVRLTGEETDFFKRLLRNGEQALNAKEIVAIHRCERNGGARDDAKLLSYHIAQRMADRVLTKLSQSSIAYLPFLIGGVAARSFVTKEILGAFSLKGASQLFHEFLCYSISNSWNVRDYSRYFKTSLKMARPKVMSGLTSPVMTFH
jgi:glycosyltransferase involved in cell wall biosynthesis